jgi:hypothetical protein
LVHSVESLALHSTEVGEKSINLSAEKNNGTAHANGIDDLIFLI